jgi:DNA invertase Pin-like site-specific DNA recombinase
METKAYSYIRFSSAEQAKGRSETRQLEACATYCLNHKLDLVQEDEYTFLDRGKSGFKAEHIGVNGQLARFLNLVDDGTIAPGSYLIVESLDRLSREHVRQALPRFIDLLNRGINIVTLSDDKVYRREFELTDLIMSILVMARAHEESSTKAKRVGDAWNKKKELARTELKPIGNASPLWLALLDEEYQLREPNASIVRRIFQMALDGHGKGAISKALNAEGVPSFKGGTWGTSSVQKILNNRAVFGEYQPHSSRSGKRVPSGTPIANYFPVVVDESTFYQAQAAIDGRKNSNSTKQSNSFNVYQGIAGCSLCKSNLHLVKKGKPPKGYTYLHCINARKGLCTAKAIRIELAEEVYAEVLARVDSLALVQASSTAISKELSELTGRLFEQETKLAEYRDFLAERPTATAYKLAADCEDAIAIMVTKQKELHKALAAEKIIDTDDFISRLDLASYEGRYRANALLKRLKVRVLIDSMVSPARYHVYQNDTQLIDIQHDGHLYIVFPHTEEQVEKLGMQDQSGVSLFRYVTREWG